MERPPLTGLWHLALNVPDVEAALGFYRDTLGLAVEWRPDPDNVYLTSGRDNLALHRSDGVPGALVGGPPGALDHFGFVLPTAAAVDAWAEFLTRRGLPPERAPRTHRDGARSFYVRDPAGNLVQFIHHPPLVPDEPASPRRDP